MADSAVPEAVLSRRKLPSNPMELWLCTRPVPAPTTGGNPAGIVDDDIGGPVEDDTPLGVAVAPINGSGAYTGRRSNLLPPAAAGVAELGGTLLTLLLFVLVVVTPPGNKGAAIIGTPGEESSPLVIIGDGRNGVPAVDGRSGTGVFRFRGGDCCNGEVGADRATDSPMPPVTGVTANSEGGTTANGSCPALEVEKKDAGDGRDDKFGKIASEGCSVVATAGGGAVCIRP